MEIPKSEIALAGYVALRMDGWEQSQGCPAWVESRDSTCGKPVEGLDALCATHRRVAQRRRDKHLDKIEAERAARAAYRKKHLPEWKEELARVEQLMEKHGAAPTTDRAAFGGAVHSSIRKAQLRQLSDTNVTRMAKLARRAEELRSLIGNN